MVRFTLLLLLLAGSVSAQTAPGATAAYPAGPVAGAAPATAADTVQALRRLFAKHRRVGGVLTIGAIGADIALAGISAANETRHRAASSGGSGYGNFLGNGPLIQFGFGGFAVIYGIMVAPVVGVGVQQLIAYGPRREAKIVAAYETTHRLPAKIQRQLRKHLVARVH